MTVDLAKLVPDAWQDYFAGAGDQLDRVTAFLNAETAAGRDWHPAPERIFRAYELCPPERLAGVLLGQDPYPTRGEPQGIAFSLPPGAKRAASARAIISEWSADLGFDDPGHTDLTPWAQQLLMANAAATTQVGVARAHSRSGWHEVTRHVLAQLVARREGLVFICWGADAQKLVCPLIAGDKRHRSICSNHPSPLAARRPPIPFYGSRPFSRFNALRAEMGQVAVDWSLANTSPSIAAAR